MPVKRGFSERAWDEIINAGADGGWIDSVIAGARENPDGPFSDVGPLLAAMLERGVSREDIGRCARWMKYEAVLATAGLAGEMRLSASVLECIHEELLMADPSGLEGCPGSWPVRARARSEGWPLELPGAEDVAFAPDSSRAWLASTSITATVIRCVALPSGEVLDEFNSLSNLRGLRCSRDGTRLAVSNHDGVTAMHDAASGKLLWKSPKTNCESRSLDITPDGSMVLVSGAWRGVRRFDAKTGRERPPLDLGKGWLVSGHALSPDGRVVVVDACRPGLDDFHFGVWDCETACEIARHPNRRPTSRFEFLADGGSLLMSSHGGVSTWSLGTQRLTKCFEVEGGVKSARLHCQERLAGVLCYERPPELRAFPSGEVLFSVERGDVQFASAWVFSPDGRFAILASSRGCLAWDLDSLLIAEILKPRE